MQGELCADDLNKARDIIISLQNDVSGLNDKIIAYTDAMTVKDSTLHALDEEKESLQIKIASSKPPSLIDRFGLSIGIFACPDLKIRAGLGLSYTFLKF